MPDQGQPEPKPIAPAEAQIKQLIRRGIPPSEAERIVADCEARGHRLMTPEERKQAAKNDAAIPEGRQWWWYTPGVPAKWKRLLDARDVKDNSE